MKKINKILLPIMATTTALAPTISLTSCGACSVKEINVYFDESLSILWLSVSLEIRIWNWSTPWDETSVSGDAVWIADKNIVRAPMGKIVQSKTVTFRENFSFTLSNADETKTKVYNLELYLKTEDGKLVKYKLTEIKETNN